jgi:hypothetical protein
MHMPACSLSLPPSAPRWPARPASHPPLLSVRVTCDMLHAATLPRPRPIWLSPQDNQPPHLPKVRQPIHHHHTRGWGGGGGKSAARAGGLVSGPTVRRPRPCSVYCGSVLCPALSCPALCSLLSHTSAQRTHPQTRSRGDADVVALHHPDERGDLPPPPPPDGRTQAPICQRRCCFSCVRLAACARACYGLCILTHMVPRAFMSAAGQGESTNPATTDDEETCARPGRAPSSPARMDGMMHLCVGD